MKNHVGYADRIRETRGLLGPGLRPSVMMSAAWMAVTGVAVDIVCSSSSLLFAPS